ncbi:hypothetical protein AVEN_268619-1 [Araneus ventricosus]|uniref:Tc1-like transposase DDE domain-containing protein n=1 Tax=Araneus ventricosus TaxID=182803 RepID=A0A4Y2GZF8_ARAVE|nr:hypothetical protein AVEN_268619-1 [Araneus ventricosus]
MNIVLLTFVRSMEEFLLLRDIEIRHLIHVRPYTGTIGEKFILMDDNAQPHQARLVEEYLEDQVWSECIGQLNLWTLTLC